MLKADLSGRRYLVTGASSGLGAHFARLLARNGAEVVVAARRAERLADLVSDIGAAGGRAVALPIDVSDEASIAACMAAAGPLDGLVNNAGIAETKPALDVSGEDFDKVTDVNLRGAFLVATAYARAAIAAKRAGTIVNIASILGLRVAGSVAAYTISKAGIVQMTKALALEWARHAIRVNALAPGYVATEINAGFFATDTGQALVKRIPMRRIGRLDDLDGPLLLLVSDASAYMTGAVIAVDGGHLVSSL